MSELKKIETKGCCGKSNIIMQLGFALDKAHIDMFIMNGYTISQSYVDKGIIFAQNKDISIMGSIGSNRLTVKCKSSDCKSGIDNIEAILKSL
jgi:hypothetical protein